MGGEARSGEETQASDRGTATARDSGVFGDVTAALATAISSVGLAIALAALIFTGPLESGLSRATTNFVLAGAIVGLIVGARGGFKPTIGVLQDGPAIVLVTLAAGLAGSSAQNPTIDVFVLIAFATLLSGLAMLVIGHLGAGEVVRFLPTTVISGFIAGTGWLLFKGGFDVMLADTLGMADLSTLVQADSLAYWMPGAALGVAIQILSRFPRVPSAALSVLVIAALVGFFGIVVAFSSIDSIEKANWLIGPFPDGTNPTLITPSELSTVDWGEVVRRPGGVLAATVVAIVAVLLNLSGLESLTRDRLDTKRELTSAGIANVLIAPLGSVAGFHALGDTALARQMGARTKAVPIGVALLSAAAAIFGSGLIGMTPRFVAGGLLVAVGLALLISWIDSMLATSSRIERVLGLIIPVSIGAVGIVEGITLGLVAACLIFVVRYSRIDPVKLEATALDLPSRVVRSAPETDLLRSTGERIVVYQLTGFQFFGSFASVAERVRARAHGAEPSLSSVVIDFRHVTGIDASAYALLDQLASDLDELDIQFLLSDLEASAVDKLQTTTPLLEGGLDFAVERAENALLASFAPCDSLDAAPFASLSADLESRLSRRSIAAGDALIEQGSAEAALFFILSGDLAVIRQEPDGSQHRLRRVGGGSVVGEHSLLFGAPRSAAIIAESASEVLQLTRADYDRLRSDEPALAIELQDHLLHELAHRSVSLTEHLARALR